MQKLVTKLSHQRDIKIDFRKIPGADHYFGDSLDTITSHVDGYIRDHVRLTDKSPVVSQGRGVR